MRECPGARGGLAPDYKLFRLPALRAEEKMRVSMQLRAMQFFQLQHRFITYAVDVATGDFRGAGTHAEVSMQLFGNRGKSPVLHLTKDLLISSQSIGHGNSVVQSSDVLESELFQRNSVQRFDITLPESLGALRSVRMSHDNDGLGAGWYLDHVTVSLSGEGADSEALEDDFHTAQGATRFSFHGWIGSSDSGGVGGPLTRDIAADHSKAANHRYQRKMSRAALSAGGAGLKLCTSGIAVPHADKVRRGVRGVNKRDIGYAGEDSYFVGSEKSLGVADGVGQWREQGIDAGEFSRALMRHSLESAVSSYGERRTASTLLVSAAARVQQEVIQGSSTVCLMVLDQATGIATIANMGDSGIVVGRRRAAPEDGRNFDLVFRSPQQEHEFGYPFQLGHHDNADHVAAAQLFEVVVEVGDIVIAGTDGLFDNLTDEEIIGDAFSHIDDEISDIRPLLEGRSSSVRKMATGIASRIADSAFWRSVDSSCDTPYSLSASEAFDIVYRGGKKDDITVVASIVAPLRPTL